MTRLFADPLPARLIWDEGELQLLHVGGRRFAVVEVMRRWRVEAEWWKGGPARDYLDELARTRGEFAQGWQYLGAVMAAQGRLREAVTAYTNALERQGRNYDVSGDGRFLINSVSEDAASSPITLLQNWRLPAK